jgi:phosphatidylglycerophosphatase A
MQRIIKLVASLFYVGNTPLFPGTAASFLVAMLYLLVLSRSFYLYAATFFVLFLLGFLVCAPAEELFGRKDSPRIVIDEAAGMLVSVFLLPANFIFVFLAFILFRIFDITKAYPAGLCERLKGSAGVMLDDIVAGIYANLCLHLIYWLARGA